MGVAMLGAVATHPPEEIDAAPATLRRWRPADVDALQELVLASIDHLRPWMPWASEEPQTLDQRRDKVLEWEQTWAAGRELAYAIVDGDGRFVGVCGLLRRIDEGGVELAYWLRPDATAQGLARAAAGALTDAALAMDGVTHVEIHHDAANVRSGRIPEALGFTLVGERAVEVRAPAETGVERIWRRTRP